MYVFEAEQATTVVERSDYTYTFTITANPPPTLFNWIKDGENVIDSDRIVTTAASIMIRNVMKSDGGMYEIVSTNSVGTGTANFSLDVQCTSVSHSLYCTLKLAYGVCLDI